MPADDNSVLEGLSDLSTADRIDAICDAFEEEWKQGAQPDLGRFVQLGNQEEQRALFRELVSLDLDYRKRNQDTVGLHSYSLQFPQYRELIEDATFELDLGDQPPTTRIASGDQIAHFEFLEKVGSGAFGEVWKARDTHLQRTVAIKLPRRQALSDTELRRFHREAQAAAKLRHSNIVPVYEVAVVDGQLFVVSMFIEGANLREWLRERQPTPQQAAELCRQIAEALQHAHDMEVVHRDLKPANILVDELGQPHVTDFGLAKFLGDEADLTLEGEILGTPSYMSPEQASGRTAEVGRATDVYSLGAVLYEMLSGRPPFEGDQAAVMRAVIENDPPSIRSFNTRLPRDLDTICLKALEKSPQHRYESCAEMAEDLHRYLRSESILARRPNPAMQAWRWCRKAPYLVASILLLLAVLVAAGIAVNLHFANRALAGLRTVTISTDVPGAQLAIAPLKRTNGEPDADRVLYPNGRTPVTLELPPGDYFIVARLDDGRFHEVYRHVPDDHEAPDWLPFPHRQWEGSKSEGYRLPEIVVAEIRTESMVACGDFYLSRYEYTADGCLAASMTFHEALATLETLGLRLPFDSEYRAVVQHADESSAVVMPVDHDPAIFGCVDAQPVRDAVIVEGEPIVGLRSNTGEWTATQQLIGDTHFQVVRGAGSDHRVIEGMNLLPRAPQAVVYVPPLETKPGLGFRAARSAQPSFFPVE